VPGGATFTRMNITAAGGEGVRATTVAGGVDLLNARLHNNGNAAGEDGLDFSDVSGTSTISGTTISGSATHNARIVSTVGTHNIDVTGSTFSAPSIVTGSTGLQITGGNSATVNADVTGSLMQSSRDAGFLVTSSPGSPQMNVNFLSNDIVGQPVNAVPASPGMSITTGEGTDIKTLVQNNDIVHSRGKAVILNPVPASNTGSTYDVTFESNSIGNATADSGSTESNAIDITAAGAATTRIKVNNNTIRHYQINAIRIDSAEKDIANGALNQPASSDFIVTSNLMSNPSPGADAMQINAGLQSAAAAQNVCADIGGAGGLANTFTSAKGGGASDFDLQISERFAGNLRFPGFVGDGANQTDIQNFIRSRNNGLPTVALIDNAISGGAACSAPAAPPSP
jgi:hypothetical protein